MSWFQGSGVCPENDVKKYFMYSGEGKDMVSIIVPVYNAANYIEQTIQSVLAQDYANWELLLVENGSTDDSVARIKAFEDERIRLIEMEGNVGAANARNEGVRQATGVYVGYIDADDVWHQNKLSKQLAFIFV